MNISLDNLGFEVDVTDVEVHQADVPKASSGSSSTGEAARRSCSKCYGRMSSFSLDKQLFCTKCRGSECSVHSRCDECFSWTKEEMESYVKLRKSLTSKSRKSKSSSRSSSSLPRSTVPECDLDNRFVTQFGSVNKVMDKKLDEMSTALMSKFSQMLAQFQPGPNIPSFSDDCGTGVFRLPYGASSPSNSRLHQEPHRPSVSGGRRGSGAT